MYNSYEQHSNLFIKTMPLNLIRHISFPVDNDQTIIVRACVPAGQEDTCKNFDIPHDTKIDFCETCSEKGCNSATSFKTTILSVVPGIIAIFFKIL